MRLSTVALLITILLTGCSREEAQKFTNRTTQSNHSQKSTQLETSIDTGQAKEAKTDSKLTQEIQFSREVTYGSTDDVIIGDIATFTVDNSNRVYIADVDKTSIHVFNPDGGFLTVLGGRGKGPGEFTTLNRYTTMTIHTNQLFVTDFSGDFPKGVQVFLPEELSFSHTMKLIAENRKDYEELQGYLPKRFFPLNDGTYLVSYRKDEYRDKTRFVYYVIQDNKGRIVNGPVVKQKGLTYLVHDEPGGYMRRMHSFPFYGKSLLAVSDDDQLYTARTEQFKIDVYNQNGGYVRTILHPFDNKKFDKDADMSDLLDMWNQQIELLTEHIEQLARQIAELINQDPALRQHYQRLRTAPGMGPVWGQLWLSLFAGQSELDPRKIASQFGFAPHPHSSGSSVSSPNRSSGYGNGAMRRVAYQAARSVATHTPHYRDYYNQKIAEGKHERLVINNIINKLIRLYCAMWNNKSEYDPNYIKKMKKRWKKTA